MRISLEQEIKNCTLCKKYLPYKPKPIFQFSRESKILIIGQAPGLQAHHSGIPWDDKSGDRLRDWLGVTSEQFYNPSLFALVPMGFCYPGKGRSGDLPPRPECASTWLDSIKQYLQEIKLEIYIGKYSCDYHFGKYSTLTALIKEQSDLTKNKVVLVHPSPRNNIWLAKNSWFENEVLKGLKKRVQQISRLS